MTSAKSIEQSLLKLADPQIAEHAQRFFKTAKGQYGEGDKFLGIRVPPLRALAKSSLEISRDEVQKLLNSKFHEIRLCAAFILVYQFSIEDQRTQAEIYQFYLANTARFNGWDLVDSTAHHIVGGYLVDKERDVLYSLAASSILWERRIAIIATFFFIRDNQFADALAVSRQLLEDKEDLIHKAVGWMLREIGKRDKDAETRFLQSYYRTMPRTMLRYAIEKFPEPERKRYLGGTA